jgi:dipeptidase
MNAGRFSGTLALAALVFFSASLYTDAGAFEDGTGCFSIVAGRKATADGAVLFGHNEDNGFAAVAGMEKAARAEHPDSEWVVLPGGGRIPQVRTTYGYWRLRMPGRDFSDCFINESGVAIASDNCPSREDKPELTDGGVGGPILRILVMERARTAREGVELIGSLIERFGYIVSGRTMMVCDSAEGWLVAMVNGKHWVARRVPDGEVAAIANTYTIREINLADRKNFLGSTDIIEYAVRRGWYDPAKGPFSFDAAYADPRTRESIGNTHRQWSALRRLAASPVPQPEEARLPFSVKPKKPLEVRDIAAALRDHYENTSYEPDGYDIKPAHKRHTSTVCGPYTNSSSVFQLRTRMPADIGALWWLALRQPCSSPYIPFYLGTNACPGELAFLTDPALSTSGGNSPTPVPGPLYTTLGELAQWMDGDYAGRIGRSRERWDAAEETGFRLQKSFESLLVSEWRSDPALARELMTRYTRGIIAGTLQDAREITGSPGGDGGGKR